MKHHIKHIFPAVLPLLFALGLQAQEFMSFNEDSLKNVLKKTGKDTSRVGILLKLSESYFYKNPDSSVLYGDRALDLSRELNFTKGILDGLFRSGAARRYLARYIEAIKMHQELLQLGERLNDRYYQSAAIGLTGMNYLGLHDYDRAIKLLRRALDMQARQSPQYTEVMFCIYLGNAYRMKNMTDSALYFLRTSERRYRLHSIPPKVSKLVSLGDAFASANSRDSMNYYYRKALRTFQNPEKTPNSFSGLTTTLSRVFASQNEFDSAFYFGRLAFKVAERANLSARMYESSALMSKLHRKKGNPDSALYYQDIAIARKDSIFGEDKNRELQLLLLDEQRRAQEVQRSEERYQNNILIIGLVTITTIILVATILLFRSNRTKQRTNLVLHQTLSELKATQSQLIQSEKMASLGELTAGIAHEIQNPLNFVNNFAEVNKELISEMETAIGARNFEEVNDIAKSIADNQEKINQHGKRADAIVKSMLQHSRSSSGQKELTDVNSLCDEYLRLAYHGFRAKDKSFNTTIEKSLDPSIPNLNIVPQDIGRVILNLINNAFYAVSEKAKGVDGYTPAVKVSTKKLGGSVEIKVEDNGVGIAGVVKTKIFQPFFTTKPAGQGTGLGLSLAYDIITKGHGGGLTVETEEGKGSTFSITIPLTK